uniref:(northern house mosquito) hypothetical protein n=1 Tax=Culex pipiens TaxID=7175 RepID=A0A8D8PAJ3_CULPI
MAREVFVAANVCARSELDNGEWTRSTNGGGDEEPTVQRFGDVRMHSDVPCSTRRRTVDLFGNHTSMYFRQNGCEYWGQFCRVPPPRRSSESRCSRKMLRSILLRS